MTLWRRMNIIKIQCMKLSKNKLNTLFLKTQSTFNLISLLIKYFFFLLSLLQRHFSSPNTEKSNKRKCRVSRPRRFMNKEQEETVEQKSKKQRKAIGYIRSTRFETQC